MSTVVLSGASQGIWTSARRKAIAAGMVGHILEWYDFAVYAYVATYIGANFFPAGDETVSLLTSLATFGVGFVARPFGSILFGRISDLRGRRSALAASYILMALATFIIGLLPSYESIGVWASILLVVARLVQGLAAGGEVSGAIVFLVEWAPARHRGFVGSFHQMASGLGFLLGSLLIAGLSSVVSHADMQAWGWRIPFLLGAIVGPLGYLLRASVDESPLFAAASRQPEPATPQEAAWRGCLRAFLFSGFWAIAFYLILSYMPTFAQRELRLAGPDAFWAGTLTLVIYVVAIPFFGHVSDRIGRKPLLILSCLGFGLLSYPVFGALVGAATTQHYFWVILLFSLLLAMYTGPAPAAISEMFRTSARGTGMAIGYTLSTSLFGGFTPFVALWLTGALKTPLAPIIYVSAAALLTAVFLVMQRETAKDSMQ